MATPAATYFDGVSARPHPVELRIADGQMDIVGTDGGVVARWPVAEVRLVDRPAGSEAPRLRRSNGGDDRLTLASRWVHLYMF